MFIYSIAVSATGFCFLELVKQGMEILIKDNKTIKEVQQQFSKEFQFLKIEFFDIPLDGRKVLSKSHVYPPHRTLGTIRQKHNEGTIRILQSTTVGDMEKMLWEKFAISIQVFRKSGNLWIETSLTDSWTLDRQNQEGKAMSQGYGSQADEREDMTDRDKWD